jgi:hypothetical protein
MVWLAWNGFVIACASPNRPIDWKEKAQWLID